MAALKMFHDKLGQTLTVWFDEPSRETIAEELGDGLVVMKDEADRAIGFELLSFSGEVSGVWRLLAEAGVEGELSGFVAGLRRRGVSDEVILEALSESIA
jgi:hypothetical protein